MWSFGLYKIAISCALRVDAASQAWRWLFPGTWSHLLLTGFNDCSPRYSWQCHSASIFSYFTWETNRFWKEMEWIWNQTKKKVDQRKKMTQQILWTFIWKLYQLENYNIICSLLMNMSLNKGKSQNSTCTS